MITRHWTALLGCLVGLSAWAAVQAAEPQTLYEGITNPSRDVTLSFTRPGQVAKVLVAEGDWVVPEQVVMQQDDLAERLNLEQLKAQATDDTKIRAAEKELAQKQVDLEREVDALKSGVSTDKAVEHARLEVEIGKLRLELSRFNMRQDKRKYEEAAVVVDRMKLRSTFLGIVEEIFLHEGEAATAQQKAIRIVQIDPLWVEIPMRVADAQKLRVGDKAEVFFPDSRSEGVQGKVVFKQVVANSASDTLRVRVEVPNRLVDGAALPSLPILPGQIAPMVLPNLPPRFRPAKQTVQVSFPTLLETVCAPQPARALARRAERTR